MPGTQFPLFVVSSISMVLIFQKSMNQCWFLITKLHIFIQISLSFTCSFFVLGSHQREHITFSCHVSLSSSWPWQFLRLALSLMTLSALRSTDQVFCRTSHNWDSSDIFLMVRLGLWVWGRKTTEIKYHSHQIL